jgi:hypothetical protein
VEPLPRNLYLVIPAKAAIQTAYPPSGNNHGPLDCRLRGNDEGKVVPPAHTGSGAQAGCARRCISLPRNLYLVIPAKAGIQAAYPPSGDNHGPLDSRLRGNDEGKAR